MKAGQAMKLHNGDEVLLKETKESVTVLSVDLCSERGHVRIEGIGEMSGYGWWSSEEVE